MNTSSFEMREVRVDECVGLGSGVGVGVGVRAGAELDAEGCVGAALCVPPACGVPGHDERPPAGGVTTRTTVGRESRSGGSGRTAGQKERIS